MARRSRREVEIEEEQLLSYMNPLELGTDKDPCFGKLFSLTAEECQICGDAVFCASRFKLKMSMKIAEHEKDNPTIDLPGDRLKAATKYIEGKLGKGVAEKLIYKMAKKRFNISKEIINQIINEY
ncbi:MAG: hypothetical protein DRJ64_04085 [Thermoprotei archaeon]|nr:MAG: hypothetical protein DRJ64_04085 [Thermoprotei archaeon]